MGKQVTDPLEIIYKKLSARNPNLETVGFDAFKADMQDDDKLRAVHDNLIKNHGLQGIEFDQFKVDMFGNSTSDAETEQASHQTAFKTSLNSDEETKFQEWRKNLPANLQPDTEDYDLRGAWKAKVDPELADDGSYHLPSRDPQTGLILKSSKHKTFDKTLQGESEAGYELELRNGRYYSVKKKDQSSDGSGSSSQAPNELVQALQAGEGNPLNKIHTFQDKDMDEQYELFNMLELKDEDLTNLNDKLKEHKFTDGTPVQWQNLPADELSKMLTGKSMEQMRHENNRQKVSSDRPSNKKEFFSPEQLQENYRLAQKREQDDKQHAENIRAVANDQISNIEQRIQQIDQDNTVGTFQKLSEEEGKAYWERRMDKANLDQARKTLQKIKDTPKDGNWMNQFMQGASSEGLIGILPFSSGLKEGIDNYMLKNAIEAVQTGKASPALSETVDAEALKREFENVNTSPNAFRYGKVFSGMLPYIGEFAATGGAYTEARAAATQGLKATLGAAAGKTAVKQAVVNPISTLVGIASQTALNPQRYVTETFRRMTPSLQAAIGLDESQIDTFIGDNAEEFGTAFSKAYGTTAAEFLTENFGKWGGDMLRASKTAEKWLPQLTLGKWMEKRGIIDLAKARETARKIGWDGVITEVWGEEYPNMILSNMITGDQEWTADFLDPTKQDFMDMVVPSMLVSGGHMAPAVAAKVAERLQKSGKEMPAGVNISPEDLKNGPEEELIPPGTTVDLEVPAQQQQEEPIPQPAVEPTQATPDTPPAPGLSKEEVQAKVADLAARIVAGDENITDEDLQLQDNYPEELERELQKAQLVNREQNATGEQTNVDSGGDATSTPEIPKEDEGRTETERVGQSGDQVDASTETVQRSEQTPELDTTNSPVQVSGTPVKNISTDVKRFQNRDEEYSEESVGKIVNAVLEGAFDINAFDPIRTWKDPKDNKTYVLSGHSRTEAFKRLQGMLEKGEIPEEAMAVLRSQGIDNFKNIPTIEMIGKTEAEAMKFAKEQSNTMATKETDLARAKLWKGKREEGGADSSIRKEIDGSTTQHLFSYLKESGQAWDAIKAVQKSGAEGVKARVYQVGEFIGEARRRFPQLSDSHENEMYEYLVNGGGKKITTRPDFMQRIDNIVNRFDFGKGDPLNLDRRVTRGFAEGNAIDERDTALEKIKSLEKERSNKNDPPSPSRMEEINAEIRRTTADLNRLNENVRKAKEADRAQGDLFGGGATPTPTTQPKVEGKTIPAAKTKEQKIREDIDATFKELDDLLGNSLAAGVNPEAAVLGAKLVGKYIELGIVKLKAIMADVYKRYGQPGLEKYFDAIKGGYASILATAEDTAGMTPFEDVRKFTIDQIIKTQEDGTGTPTTVESDRPRVEPIEQVGKKDVPDEGTSGEQSTQPGGGITADSGVGQQGDTKLPDSVPVTGSVQRDPAVSRKTSEPVGERVARGAVDTGSDSAHGTGISFDSPSTEKPLEVTGGEDTARLDFSVIIAQQAEANKLPVMFGQVDNIRQSLPMLLEHQLENVSKAETRFLTPSTIENPTKGIMFTDGTGTGKTYTGLGIANRYYRSGKKKILVIAPSDTKVKDWNEDAANFGMPLTQLKGITDAGPKGAPVTTTFANMAFNEALMERAMNDPFDLILIDESHKLLANQAGETNLSEEVFKNLSHAPNQVRSRIEKDLRDQGYDWEDIQKKKPEIDKQVKKFVDATKVVFLSATPFAYHKTLKYADGYLFTIEQGLTSEERSSMGRGYNDPNAYQQFFITNFGYQMRYNKLNHPSTEVDQSLMERAFHTRMVKTGAISSTRIKLEKDYSRQFVQFNSQIGNAIDEGWKLASDYKKYKHLPTIIDRVWRYPYEMQLLEAIKSREMVLRAKEHIKMGRKVILFHSYKENFPVHPFDFAAAVDKWGADYSDVLSMDRKIEAMDEVEKFHEEHPEFIDMDLSSLEGPIATFKKAFGDKAMFFNGDVPKNDRKRIVGEFNTDDNGKDLLIVQIDAGKEGISLHDITGNHARALIFLGLPIKPTDAIQAEGRGYRIGQMSNAVIEYPIISTMFEKNAFGRKINERVSTVENLAFGEQGRNLKNAFKEGYKFPTEEDPNDKQGTGGKAIDFQIDTMDLFDQAKTFYYGRQKKTSKTKSAEGVDYFATAEPMGLKMFQWAYSRAGEKMLEPSAGHGAIARWFQENTANKFIEPSIELRGDLQIAITSGEIITSTFEDLDLHNKFDGIVMNPPFGTNAKTAMDHLVKATRHLNDGGRIVALVPDGPAMNKRFEKWAEQDEDGKIDGKFAVMARVQLPSVLFERAGTSVRTQLIIIDKYESLDIVPHTHTDDWSHFTSINEFFEYIRDREMFPRLNVKEASPIEKIVAQAEADMIPHEVVKGVHTKNGHDIWTVKMGKRLSEGEYGVVRDKAKQFDGYYSHFKGNGAIPGFVFRSADKAGEFSDFLNAGLVDEEVGSEPLSMIGESTESKGRQIMESFERRPAPPINDDKDEPFKLYQSVKDLAHKYNSAATIGEGYTHRAEGLYYNDTGNVRIKGLNNLSVAMHELTHALDNGFKVITNFIKAGDMKMREDLTKLYVEYYPKAKPDHRLRTRMVEGYATLVQKYLERPAEIKTKYPDLVKEFLLPSGKYFQPEVAEFVQDASEVIAEYQNLDSLEQIGSRFIDGTIDEPKRFKWLNTYDKITAEIADFIYPIEKLEEKNGTAWTTKSVSLALRMARGAYQVAYRNIFNKKGKFWALNDQGEWVETAFAPWGNSLSRWAKNGQADKFGYYLGARRWYEEFKEMEDIKEELEYYRTSHDEIVQNFIDDMGVSEPTAEKIYLAKLADLTARYEEIRNILKNDEVIDDTEELIEPVVGAVAAGKQLYSAWEKEYDQYTRQILDMLHNPKVGLLDDATYQKLIDKKGYATLKRGFFDELIGTAPVKQTTVPNQSQKVSTLIKRKGGGQPIINPLVSYQNAYIEATQKAMKQMAYNNVIHLADGHPELFQIVPLSTSPDPKNRYPQEKDKNIIMARRGYKRVPILVNADVKGIIDETFDFHSANVIESIGIAAAQAFRVGTTGIYPEFLMSNLPLDTITATLNTRNGMWPIISMMNHVIGKALINPKGIERAYMREYLFLNGSSQFYGVADLKSQEDVQDLLVGKKKRRLWVIARKGVNKLLHVLSLPGAMSEMATRVTEYILARKSGKSQYVAWEEAGRVTGPYHHVGSMTGKYVGKELRDSKNTLRMYPYLNPALVHLDNLARQIRTPEGRKRYIIGLLLMTAAAGASTAYIMGLGDDDERKQNLLSIPPDAMNKYIYFPSQDSADLIRIRIPEQLGSITSTFNMAMMEAAGHTSYRWSEYADAATGFLPTQLNPSNPGQMLFSLVPQAIKPEIEVAANVKTYPNIRPLESPRPDKENPAKLRYDKYTSPLAVWGGDKASILLRDEAGFSPKKIDHLLEGHLGRIARKVTGKEPLLAIGKTFEREFYFQASRQVQNFYEMYDKAKGKLKADEEEKLVLSNEDRQKWQNIYDLCLDMDSELQEFRDTEDSEPLSAAAARKEFFRMSLELEKLPK